MGPGVGSRRADRVRPAATDGEEAALVARYACIAAEQVDGLSEGCSDSGTRPLNAPGFSDPAQHQLLMRRSLDANDLGDHAAQIRLRRAFVHLEAHSRRQRVGRAIGHCAAWVAEHGLTSQGPYRAGRDLLLRERPRHLGGDNEHDLRLAGEDLESAARRLALTLDDGVLPIQGPPGAGKTYIGARMIVELVKNGRKVGITATSHRVIQQLVKEAADAASQEGVTLRCIRKVGDDEKPEDRGPLQETNKNGAVSAALASGEVRVVAGTSWLWSRPELACTVDVLFVDEAGQMSLADVLAVSQAARSVVLIGDPQQLEQPIQGSHPEGRGGYLPNPTLRRDPSGYSRDLGFCIPRWLSCGRFDSGIAGMVSNRRGELLTEARRDDRRHRRID